MELYITMRVGKVSDTHVEFTILEGGEDVGQLKMSRKGFDIFALRLRAFEAMKYVAETLKVRQEDASGPKEE